MRRGEAVGLAGALATALAVVVVLGPDVAPVVDVLAPFADWLSGLGAERLLFASIGLVALSVLASVLVPGGERVVTDDGASERFERVLDRPPEGVASTAPRTAADLDAVVQRAVAGDDEAVSTVRDRLRELGTETLTRRTDDTGETPAERVESGTWTDDRTAAAFLADEAGPAFPLRSRLRLWLDPETERERRIRRTVAAVTSLADDEFTGGVGRD